MVILGGCAFWASIEKGPEYLDIPFLITVEEAISRMKQGKVVDILYVALGKMRVEREFLAEEMKRIQRFSLGLCDGRNIGVSWQVSEPDKIAAPADNSVRCYRTQVWVHSLGELPVLQADPLWGGRRGFGMEHQRPRSPLLLRVLLKHFHIPWLT